MSLTRKEKKLVRKNTPAAEVEKLVEFFNSEEGLEFGVAGDADNLTPAETAIKALRAYSDLRDEAGDEADVFGREWA